MIKKICAACVATMLISSVAMAEDKKDDLPSEVNADAIEYDMNTGIVAAEGNVLLKHGTAKATGLHALFNVNTKEAHLIGNVIVVREDMRITCNALMSNGQGHMQADGNVIATQNLAPNEKYPNGDTRTFTGEDKIIATGNVKISKEDMRGFGDLAYADNEFKHFGLMGHARILKGVKDMEEAF